MATATEVLSKMIAEIARAGDQDDARVRAFAQHGAARMAFALGAITFDDWERFDEAGGDAFRAWQKTHRAGSIAPRSTEKGRARVVEEVD